MTRPTARKSSLAGASPIAPAEPAQGAPQVAPSTAPAPVGAKKPRAKVSFYQDPEDTNRMRGAILHTMTTEGSRTLTQFINAAVLAEVERLEAKYNGGRPFPPIGPGELPQGRPMGE